MVALIFIVASAFAAEAPDAPGKRGHWGRPDKEAFLATLKTKTWATIADGVLSEVYFPLIDRAQSSQTELFFVSKTRVLSEALDFKSISTRYPETLAYNVQSNHPESGISIDKDLVLSAIQNGIYLEYLVTLPTDDWQLFIVHSPTADNTFGGDQGQLIENGLIDFQVDRRNDEPPILSKRTFQILLTEKVIKSSVGFNGRESDPRLQMMKYNFLDRVFDVASYGNIVGALQVPASKGINKIKIALAFREEQPGENNIEKLKELAGLMLKSASETSMSEQRKQWNRYLNGLSPEAKKNELDILVLKGLEDKTFPGAVVAAPARPWLPASMWMPEFDYESARLHKFDSNSGYTRVWPRDLFHIGLAFLAVADFETARSIASYLKFIQLPNGQFPQNTWVNGEQSWSGFQLDQTGYPIIFISRLVELGVISYKPFREMVLQAADVLMTRGPWTEQERWEETGGLSPNSIAVACQGLMEASWLERELNPLLSEKYHKTCDAWRKQIFDWTFVKTGPLGDNYFERLETGQTKVDPNYPSQIKISNNPPGGDMFLETEIIDGGFLAWILSGLLNPNDWRITSTLKVYDRIARGPAFGGLGYIRYNHDAYGMDHVGKAWPLLSGERALASLMRGEEYQTQWEILQRASVGAGMSPEQDGLSATPLAWSHALRIIISKSIAESKNFYLPRRLNFYE